MAWYDHLEYGDPVVCVKSWQCKITGKKVAKGSVYLTSHVVIAGDGTTYAGEVAIVLTDPSADDGYGWLIRIFRPATSTDLPASIREALKTPAPKEKV
jgi:hypothetical protein